MSDKIKREHALHTARVAIKFRRQKVIENWLGAFKRHDLRDMQLWAGIIEDLNDAHWYLLVEAECVITPPE